MLGVGVFHGAREEEEGGGEPGRPVPHAVHTHMRACVRACAVVALLCMGSSSA